MRTISSCTKGCIATSAVVFLAGSTTVSVFLPTCDGFLSPVLQQQQRQQRPSRIPPPPPQKKNHHHKQSSILNLGTNPDRENSSQTTTPLNSFSSFLAKILPTAGSIQETEEEREKRLALERRQEISELETKRQERVKEDAIPYLFLLSLQFLPLIDNGASIEDAKLINKLYFLGTAITTVYLGSRQETIYKPETVSKKSALGAPIGASFAIGFLYLLIKFGLDPTSVYAILVSIYGVLSISDIGVPLLRNVLEPFEKIANLGFATAQIKVPQQLSEVFGSNPEDPPDTIPVERVSAVALGVLATAIYWAPSLAMEQKFLVSNLIAWSIGMASLGVISLGTFQTGAILLGGLFFYDIFFVFGTDVMMTVALKIEAPVKFLYPAPPSDVPREYPFSVLGLGDVVIPGIFVRFMTKLDASLQPTRLSYATTTTIAYGVGLLVCFVANELTNSGQPALLYLNPACVGSAIACGAANGQLQEVWNFEDETATSSSRYDRKTNST